MIEVKLTIDNGAILKANVSYVCLPPPPHRTYLTSSQRTKFGIGETGNLKYMSTSDDKGDSPLVCSN